MSFKGVGIRLGNASSSSCSSSSSSAVIASSSDHTVGFSDDPLLAETLFLVSRFLGGLDSNTFAQSHKTFDNELAASNLLGRVYHWSGSSRAAVPQDLARKFTGCPHDQLLRHLRRSMGASSGQASGAVTAANSSYSLLRTMTTSTDSIHPSSNNDNVIDMTNGKLSFKEMVVRMIDSETALYSSGKFCKELMKRKAFLSNLLESLSHSAALGNSTVEDSVRLISAEEELGDISLTLKHNDEKALEVRRSIDRLYKDLADSNKLGSSSRRGAFDSGLCYLIGRQVGLATSPGFSLHPTNGLFKSSAADIKRKIATKYSFLCRIGGHKIYPVYTCCFDMTGNYIITGGDDYLVKVWLYEEAALVYTLKGHKGEITILQVSPDNALVASACTQGSIRLWRLHDGQCLRVLQHGTVQVNYLKFNELTYTVSTVGDDGQCIVWDLHRILRSDEESIPQLRFMAQNKVQKVSADDCTESNRLISYRLEIVPLKSTHLFQWSASEDSLVLPHTRMSNMLSIGSNEAKLKIYILDVHPVENILITGGEDGIARLWTFKDVNRRETRALRETKKEMSAQSADALSKIFDQLLLSLEGHKGKISDTKFSNLGDRIVTGSDEDCTVRIWTFDKTYTKYEYVSLNMVGGEEGGDTESYFLQNLRGRTDIAGRGRRAPIRKKSQLYSVCWSVDDQYIVTLQSDLSNDSMKFDVSTLLKIWDSYTGSQLRMIRNICSSMCSLLMPHPRDPRIVATAGNDGFLNVWNIYEETNIARIKIPYEKETPELEFEPALEFGFGDIAFSPDGTKISLTDTFGGLSLIGLEVPAKYEDALTEQYFSTDYAEVILDADGFAIDAGTQLAVGVSPRGPLCRNDGSSYDDQPPAHRGPPPTDIIDVERRIRDNVSMCNELADKMDRNIIAINARRNNPKKSPPPLARKGGQTQNSTISTIHTLSSQHRRKGPGINNSSSSAGAGSSSNGNRQGSRYKSEDTTWLYEISSDDASARDSDWDDREMGRCNGHKFALHGNSSNGDDNDGDDDDDDDVMEVDGIAVRTSSRIKSNKKHKKNTSTGRKRADRGRGAVSSNSSGHRLRSSRGGERAGGMRSSSRLGSSQGDRVRYDEFDGSSCSDDHYDSYEGESDDKQSRRRPAAAAASKKKPPRKRIRINDSDEGEVGFNGDYDYGEADEEEEEYFSSSRAYPKSFSSSSGVDTKKKSNNSGRHKTGHVAAYKSNIYWDTNLDGKAIPLGVGVDRLWLQEERQYEYQYCPQVGDRVIYLPQGHTQLLQMFPENRQPPWLSWPARWPLVECEVRSVSYAFPTKQEYPLCHSIVAHITLALIRIPLNRRIASNGQVTVELSEPRATRNQHDHIIEISMRNYYTPDFIVPSSLFERTNSNTELLSIGTSVEVYYKEVALDGGYFYERYPCSVSALRDANAADWQLSPWENVSIQFPDGVGDEAISPWEAIISSTVKDPPANRDTTLLTELAPPTAASGRSTRNGSSSRSISDVPTASNSSSRATRSGRVISIPEVAVATVAASLTTTVVVDTAAHSVLPSLSPSLRSKIIAAIESTVESNADVYSPFHYEVDSAIFEDYYRLIPVPVYVDLILRRLECGYYRQLASLRADVDLIYTNCSLYNKPDTPILNAALLLRDELREIVNNA